MSFIGERKVECMPMKITFEFDGKVCLCAFSIFKQNKIDIFLCIMLVYMRINWKMNDGSRAKN